MSPEQLAKARGEMIAGLQKANAIGSWLAVIFMFDKLDPNRIGCGFSGENIAIEAITRGRPVETLPAINQALITRMKRAGGKILAGKAQGGLFVSDNGQAGGKIIDPTAG